MQENYSYVQEGFRELVKVLSDYIGVKMYEYYGEQWWDEILNKLSDQWDLPAYGEYEELIGSLDIANCIRLLDRSWSDVFGYNLSKSSRSYAKELMGVRNIVAHIGQNDLEQLMAERALDTMVLLCQEINKESAEKIRELHMKVRARVNEIPVAEPKPYWGLEQPITESGRGPLKEGSLLSLVGTETVQKTQGARKITFNGVTKLYPVYKINLSALYYNDQNDRIATRISAYEAENGEHSLEGLNIEIYNRIIEDFIVESNPAAIEQTQNNIKATVQRVPGVTLADGRVVDGNRRLTCLRRIQRESGEQCYFETVIMDADFEADEKQIKLLELAIQHGEEEKVAYDLIEYAIGTYRSIEQTKLITVEEYAHQTGEKKAEVLNRIEIAKTICKFLEHLKLPGQYHIARDYQVYSVIKEMLPIAKKMPDETKDNLMTCVFNNTMLKAEPDQRKFIRDIKKIAKSAEFEEFFNAQARINDRIVEAYESYPVHDIDDINQFAEDNSHLVLNLRSEMETALNRMRKTELADAPTEKIIKCFDIMMEIDPRLFGKMDPEEKEKFQTILEQISLTIKNFKRKLK